MRTWGEDISKTTTPSTVNPALFSENDLKINKYCSCCVYRKSVNSIQTPVFRLGLEMLDASRCGDPEDKLI